MIRLTISLLLAQAYMCGQTVLSGVYLKEHVSKKYIKEYISDEIIYEFTVNDSLKKIIRSRVDHLTSFAAKQPFHLEGFVFFNTALQQLGDTGALYFVNRLLKSKDKVWETTNPPSLKYYACKGAARISIDGKIRAQIVTTDLEKYFTPFYFKNTEVTNKEYREFVTWIRDSLAHELLYKAGYSNHKRQKSKKDNALVINWDEDIHWNHKSDEYRSVFEELYLPSVKKFYSRKEFDTRKFVYAAPGYSGEPVAIYPDTLCWMNRFPWSFFEPMTNNYFWHPAYDNFPVVGLKYNQVLAFLDWKTRMMQATLDKKGVKFQIRCELPSEAEWESVTMNQPGGKKTKTKLYTDLADNSWIFDLHLYKLVSRDTAYQGLGKDTAIVRIYSDFLSPLLFNKQNYYDKSRGVISLTRSAMWKKEYSRNKYAWLYYENSDPNGIEFMGNNVSELMCDEITGGFLELRAIRARWLRSSGLRSAVLLAELEGYYDSVGLSEINYQMSNCRMVRGSNWLDGRIGLSHSRNLSGYHAKGYIREDQTYPTVGFRYVVHFEPK